MLHIVALLSLFLAAAAPMASGQNALATKFAQAIANENGVPAKVYIGALPPAKITGVALPKYTLLGSVVETPPVLPGTAGAVTALGPPSSTTLYYETPADALDALAAYENQLVQSGWHELKFLQEFQEREEPRGGFVVAPKRTPDQRRMYCNDRGALAVGPVRSLPDVFSISVVTGGQAAQLCAVSKVFETMPSPPPLPALPTLRASANIQFGPADSNALYQASSRSEAMITSALTPTAIGSAFAQQIVAGGWSQDEPAESATAYLQTFHMTSQGHRYQAAVILTGAGKSNTYHATMRLIDLDAPSANGFMGLPFFSR